MVDVKPNRLPLSSARILVSNDDGIHAPGLTILEQVAAQLSKDVWVVAPESEQSGSSHSLTLHGPLRMREAGPRRFAVQGTPTDCVMMAVRHVLKDRAPDLVLSGVNRGSNLAEDVTYSGTVAAAMEGTVLGIPSIALSQSFGYRGSREIPWTCAGLHAGPLVQRLWAAGWPQGVLINVNFPDCAPDKVKGIWQTRQGLRDESRATIEERTDTRGHPYFWIGFQRVLSDPLPGTDLYAIYNDAISVTALHLNLTAEEVRFDLERPS